MTIDLAASPRQRWKQHWMSGKYFLLGTLGGWPPEPRIPRCSAICAASVASSGTGAAAGRWSARCSMRTRTS